jgi:hypothetical protein
LDPVDIEILRAELDALVGELEAERWRHVAGLEPAPTIGAIFDAHHRAAHKDTLAQLVARGEPDLANRVAMLRVERVQAEEEEAWREAEIEASALGPDGPVTLDEAALALLGERDRGRRLAFGRAVGDASNLAAREAAVEKRARARAEVALLPEWEAVVEGDLLLAATDDAYRDVLGWLVRREAGLSLPPSGDLARADLLFALALHGWDGLFPRGMLAIVLEKSAAPLRLELGRVRIDDAARPGAWPGAHALGTRVSLRRQGGAADYAGLFEAAGAALANAAAPPHRRAPAAPFTVGALLAGLLSDRAFLAARLDVERKHAADLSRALALRQLFRLRARAAALRVAAEVERGASGAAWHEAHRDALTAASLAAWPYGLAARDADGAAHLAALRGAARAEVLRRELVERCDTDWWKNPRSVPVLGNLLAAGGAWEREEPKLALAGEGLVAVME